MQCNFPALGTQWWIEIWDTQTKEQAAETERFCRLIVNEFENKFSRFKTDSLISRLNHDRVLASPSDETRTLLHTGIEYYRRTNGLFNILTGHIQIANGYDANYSFRYDGAADRTPGNPTTGIIMTDGEIQLLGHTHVDIGGYGKGYLIDLLATALHHQHGLEQFLINGGGDIYATHHNGEPVEIYLEDPLRPGVVVGTTHLHNQAFAASSPLKRRWPVRDASRGTSEQHHIVAEATVRDAVYLTAQNATDADVWATTLLQISDLDNRELTLPEEIILVI
jgi:thiamine biosynthesis lipoprotein